MTDQLPATIDETITLLDKGNYVSDRSLATALHLALAIRRPLFLEGEAGVGKTEIAKVLSETLGRRLVRLQCYEGLDAASAVYEWNYSLQMIEIRLSEAVGDRDRNALENDLFSEKFLIKRPLLQALEPSIDGPAVLLIDELDRTDEPFEAYLLEVLSDFQMTIPQLGTIKAPTLCRLSFLCAPSVADAETKELIHCAPCNVQEGASACASLSQNLKVGRHDRRHA